MQRESPAKRYFVALGFLALSLWTFHQILSALGKGFIYTLAIKHPAHLIVFRDNPFELIATLVLYFVIGPVLGSVYVYINFMLDWRKPPTLGPREILEQVNKAYEVPPLRRPSDDGLRQQEDQKNP